MDGNEREEREEERETGRDRKREIQKERDSEYGAYHLDRGNDGGWKAFFIIFLKDKNEMGSFSHAITSNGVCCNLL